MLLIVLTGWLDRRERQAIAYLIGRESTPAASAAHDDCVSRMTIGAGWRANWSAVRPSEIATIATPDTLLRWHRQLIARK